MLSFGIGAERSFYYEIDTPVNDWHFSVDILLQRIRGIALVSTKLSILTKEKNLNAILDVA